MITHPFLIDTYTGHDQASLRYGKLVAAQPQPDMHPAILYIPGLGGSVKGALPFLEGFLNHYPTIYGLDLRGFGINGHHAVVRSPHHFLADAMAFIDQHDLFTRHSEIILMGLSLGGATATWLAAQTERSGSLENQVVRYPFRSLVLLAPAFSGHNRHFGPGYLFNTMVKTVTSLGRATTRLPYNVSHITRNTQVHSDPHAQAISEYDYPVSLLLSLKAWTTQAGRQVNQLQLPTWIGVPGLDEICCPIAMRAAYQRLPEVVHATALHAAHVQAENIPDKRSIHHCQEYPELYHDLVLEPERHQIQQDILEWLRQL